MHRVLFWAALAVVLRLPVAFAETEAVRLDSLLNAAPIEELASEPQWHALLHYREMSWGLESQADDPRFFLAEEGKRDPAAELVATIKGVFAPAKQYPEEGAHPRCRFPARFAWLVERLRLSPAELPAVRCRAFEEWFAALAPYKATLIYPASYLNNPASSFGHAFIRIDAAEQDDSTRLLAYGASYAAATNESMGTLFAMKSIFGGYVGNFSVTPYYMQVRKYSDMESRDIWEYELRLTPQEVRRMVEHLWELRGIAFDYYFFDENCASQLLTLIDVARPSLRLSEEFTWFAIPLDTVRETVSRSGLMERAVYRPAASAYMRERLLAMPEEQQALSLLLANGLVRPDDEEFGRYSPKERARMLELAAEYLRYREQARRDEESETAREERRRSYELLRARSELDVALAPLRVPAPPVRPDEGHRSARLRLAAGVQDRQLYTELRLRPAFHDLLDDDAGYPRGAELDFLDFALRYYEGEGLELERFSLLSILSLSPRSEFIRPISWRARIGMDSRTFADGDRDPVYGITAGPGVAYEPLRETLLYAILNVSGTYSPEYEEHYALGAGPEGGLLWDMAPGARLQLKVAAQRFFLGDDHTTLVGGAEQRFTVDRQRALRLGWYREREVGDYNSTAFVAFDLYF